MKRPTMRDVAATAGVSVKTVSRVVNAESGVRPPIVARVEEAIEALGYRPDRRAQQLRQSEGRSSTIGFVSVDVSNQFFGTLLRGIDLVATKNDCVVLSGITDRSATREQKLLEAFVERRVDGLILVYSGSSASDIEAEEGRGTPVVFVDLEPKATGMDVIRSDHYAGARTATEHLLKHGHVDISYFGDDPEVYSATLRAQGFCDAMLAAGHMVPRQRLVTGRETSTGWKDLAIKHFHENGLPTAVFTAQNRITIGVAEALHELGLRETVAQVGFDDVDLAPVVTPALTVVRQDPLGMGRLAAEVLFKRIAGDTRAAHREVLPCPIVPRGSGELPPNRKP